MVQYVLGYAFSEDESKVVLIEKNRPEVISGCFIAPGGKIEEGEIGLTAMVREFEEETGVVISHWKSEFKITGPDYTIEVFSTLSDSIFDVETVTDEKVIISDVSTLPSKCSDDTKWMVPFILDKKHIFRGIIAVI